MFAFMKATLIFNLCYLILSIHASGQDTTGGFNRKAVFGIAVGPNLSKASLASYDPTIPGWGAYTSSSFAVGFDARLFLIVPLSREFYFRPQVGFTLLNQKQLYSNTKMVGAQLSTDYIDKLTESQLDVSALFGYRAKSFSIELGPQVGIVTGATTNSVMRTYAYNGTFNQGSKTDFKHDKMANTVVFSVLVGLCKPDLYKNFGAGIYYNMDFSDYTQYENLRQITRVNGFLLTLTLTL
jgi:hypothetical protein